MAASQRLTRALHQQLGDELSRELLTWMDQMDSTRSELTHFRDEMARFVVQTSQRFDTLDTRMETGFARVDAKVDALEHKLAVLIEKRHAELMRWAFVFWCGSVFAMVALIVAATK